MAAEGLYMPAANAGSFFLEAVYAMQRSPDRTAMIFLNEA